MQHSEAQLGSLTAPPLPTDNVSLSSGKLGITMQSQSEANADISVNICTAHTGTVITMPGGGEVQQSALRQQANTSMCLSLWLQMILAMNINVWIM